MALSRQFLPTPYCWPALVYTALVRAKRNNHVTCTCTSYMYMYMQARSARDEVLLENLLEDSVIDPEVDAMTRDVITEVCDAFSNSKRRRGIRQVKHDVGDNLMDGLCLDYLLLLSVKQGRIWTENEHVIKVLDGQYSMIMRVLVVIRCI